MRSWKTAAVCAVILAGFCAGTAKAEEATPVDRKAAMARAPQFAAPIEAALTRPVNDLYLKALSGEASDKWTYALALVAERYSLDALPAAQRDLYSDYAKRGATAKQAYADAHPDEDISGKGYDDFVPPTPDEVQAIRAANAINDPDLWFQQAGRMRNGVVRAIDPEVLAQSRQCLEAVKGAIDADDLMNQLMSGLSEMSDLPEEVTGGSQGTQKSDFDRDQEALCGGEKAWDHITVLMKAVYTPSLQITVSRGNVSDAAQGEQ